VVQEELNNIVGRDVGDRPIASIDCSSLIVEAASMVRASLARRGDPGHIREATVKSKYEFSIPTFRPDISESPLYFGWMMRDC
jgi:hypothetical protein